nr:hypothetical protein [Tanacetum cinerariifolium]
MKCFKEVTSSLKGWKKNFFLIDQRAVSNTMPWRHIDTDVRNDFPNHYNEGDVKRLAKFHVPFRPPPRRLLYVCGLTTACRHPKLSYTIKDPEEKELSMNDYLKLSVWNRTVREIHFKRLLKNPTQILLQRRQKKDKQNLAKAQANRAGEGVLDASRKKRDRRNQEPTGSGSEKTISITPLHHATLKPADETISSVSKNTTGGLFPLIVLSFYRVACKEMITYLATPVEEEFLNGLTNIEVVRRTYQSMGRCVLSKGELLKRHEQLNSEHVDLRNRSDTQLEELNRLRTDLQTQMQTNDGLSKHLVSLDGAHSSCEDKEIALMGEGVLDASRKKRDCRNQEPTGFGSERTISITPLHHATLKPADETISSVSKNTTGVLPLDLQRRILRRRLSTLAEILVFPLLQSS